MGLLDYYKTTYSNIGRNLKDAAGQAIQNIGGSVQKTIDDAAEREVNRKKNLVYKDYINRFGGDSNNSQRRIADLNTPESVPYYGRIRPFLKFEYPGNPDPLANTLNQRNEQLNAYKNQNIIPDPLANTLNQQKENAIVDPDTIVDPNQIEPEEKTSRFESLFNIFDDKDRLAKIATGIALMEGTPIKEAFELGANIRAQGAIEGGSLFDFINKKTGVKQFTRSNKDPQFNSLVNSGLFDVVPVGTGSELNNDFKLAAFKDDLEIGKIYGEAAIKAQESLVNITELEKLFDEGFQTGAVSTLGLPIRNILNDMGFTDDENVDKQILFQTLISRIIPTMREEGSGSTSDFEVELFTRATAALKNSTLVNKKLIQDMAIAARMNVERSRYINKAIRKTGAERKDAYSAELEFAQFINQTKSKDFNYFDLDGDDQKTLVRLFGGIPLDGNSVPPANGTYYIMGRGKVEVTKNVE